MTVESESTTPSRTFVDFAFLGLIDPSPNLCGLAYYDTRYVWASRAEQIMLDHILGPLGRPRIYVITYGSFAVEFAGKPSAMREAVAAGHLLVTASNLELTSPPGKLMAAAAEIFSTECLDRNWIERSIVVDGRDVSFRTYEPEPQVTLMVGCWSEATVAVLICGVTPPAIELATTSSSRYGFNSADLPNRNSPQGEYSWLAAGPEPG